MPLAPYLPRHPQQPQFPKCVVINPKAAGFPWTNILSHCPGVAHLGVTYLYTSLKTSGQEVREGLAPPFTSPQLDLGCVFLNHFTFDLGPSCVLLYGASAPRSGFEITLFDPRSTTATA